MPSAFAMGTRVEQSGEFLPRAGRTSRRHLEDMADSLHRLPSAGEDLQVIIPRRHRTLLLQGEFCITLVNCGWKYGHRVEGLESRPVGGAVAPDTGGIHPDEVRRHPLDPRLEP